MEEKAIIDEALSAMRRWDADGIAPEGDTAAYIERVQNEIAPIAERLGYAREQGELEELSVKLGFPDDYKRIRQLRLESEMTCEMVFRTFSMPIRSMLDDLGIDYDFMFRMKSVYSIWRKMTRKGAEFDDVYDLFGTRIVYRPKPTVEPLPFSEPNGVDAEAAEVKQWQLKNIDVETFYCWRIYTVISMLYRIHPDRIRNWISHPKPSGYQALQLTVMGPDCNWVEIQIRSERMNYEAEYGKAVHWKYKQEK